MSHSYADCHPTKRSLTVVRHNVCTVCNSTLAFFHPPHDVSGLSPFFTRQFPLTSTSKCKADARDVKETAEEDARLQAVGVAEMEQERETQMAAVADGIDPKKEAARIRERHVRDAVSGRQYVPARTLRQRLYLLDGRSVRQ